MKEDVAPAAEDDRLDTPRPTLRDRLVDLVWNVVGNVVSVLVLAGWAIAAGIVRTPQNAWWLLWHTLFFLAGVFWIGIGVTWIVSYLILPAFGRNRRPKWFGRQGYVLAAMLSLVVLGFGIFVLAGATGVVKL